MQSLLSVHRRTWQPTCFGAIWLHEPRDSRRGDIKACHNSFSLWLWVLQCPVYIINAINKAQLLR